MKALLQRVSEASVTVDGECIARIGPGLLVLLGVERGDDAAKAQRLAARTVGYRVFADAAGKMNLGLGDSGGSLLVVPQFTLAADTGGGNRPSFTPAAPPDLGLALYECYVAAARAGGVPVACGRFGADMQVALVNDGPATFLLTI